MNAPHAPLDGVAEHVTVAYVGPTTQFFRESGIPYLRTGNVGKRGLILDEVRYVTEEFHRKNAKSALKPGDVLVTRVISDEIGCGIVPEGLGEANCGNVIAIRPGPNLLPEYLVHLIRSPAVQRALIGRRVGSAQSVVNTSVLKAWTIQILSLVQQRRIAEVLDRAEALRAKRRAALEQLDTLTQSIFHDLFGDPARNTKGLPTTTLGALGGWQSGGTPPRSRHDYFEGSIPWFSSGELEGMYVSQSVEHISEAALTETSAKRVPRGALMLGMYDTAALKASIAAVDGSCNQAIAFCRLNESITLSQYVYYAIVIGREHFRRLQRGVRQKNLNLSLVRDIEIPLPTIAAQKTFVRNLAMLEKIRSTQRASLAELDSLFASLQHRAFRGEL